LFFALLSCLTLSAPPGDARRLTVSAAVSLTDALEEIARAYSASGGGEVRFNFGGSNVLARQIVSGAPVDIFISADQAQMALAESFHTIDVSTRVPLLRNRLAVVTRRDGPAVADVRALTSSSVRKIAIGDPAAVPAGVYAQRYLRAIGLWDSIQSKLVPVGNVRAALAAAASGSVDVAFVYETDAKASPNVALAFVVDGVDAPAIIYPAAVTTRASDRVAALRFLQFLSGPEARAIFARYGFTPSAGTR
jgi:molybdate transport system substrate-binding protein